MTTKRDGPAAPPSLDGPRSAPLRMGGGVRSLLRYSTERSLTTIRQMPAATNRQLAVRLAVGRALGRTRDLDDVYGAALDTLAECLHVSRASILLFDPDGVMRLKARSEERRV